MSVFTPFKLAGLACVGVGGTCSMVYAGSLLLDFSQVEADDDSVIQTVADKFSTRLISTKGSSRDGVWKSRLEKLRKHENGDLDKTLKEIKENKDKKKTEKDLKDWCEGAKIKPHEGKENELLVKGVEDYCTYNIGDQASKVVPKTKGNIEDWKLVNEAFLKAKKDSLSKDLQDVYDKVKEGKDTSLDLKKWCFEKYDEPFKGKDDPLYKSVTKFCAVVKPPRSVDSNPSGGPKQAGDI